MPKIVHVLLMTKSQFKSLSAIREEHGEGFEGPGAIRGYHRV